MKKFLFSIAALLMAFTANAQDLSLSLGTVEADADSYYILPVDMDNSMEVVGWSMKVYSPETLVLEEVALSEDRYETYGRNKTNYHTYTLTKTADGGVLVVCYATDMDHRVIKGNSGRLCDLVFNGTDYKGENPVIEIKEFQVALADASQINMEGSVATGIDFITREISADGNNAVYNLKGQRVEKAGKGLYIVNGKKIVK